MQGDELKALRKAVGLTQSQLATALDLTPQFVGMMERGEKAIEWRTEVVVRELDRATKLCNELRETIPLWIDGTLRREGAEQLPDSTAAIWMRGLLEREEAHIAMILAGKAWR